MWVECVSVCVDCEPSRLRCGNNGGEGFRVCERGLEGLPFGAPDCSRVRSDRPDIRTCNRRHDRYTGDPPDTDCLRKSPPDASSSSSYKRQRNEWDARDRCRNGRVRNCVNIETGYRTVHISRFYSRLFAMKRASLRNGIGIGNSRHV